MNIITFSCCSNIGRIRRINQDNYFCDGLYLQNLESESVIPEKQIPIKRQITLFGVFDGLGGEECGEIASLIAAKTASEFVFSKDISKSMDSLCKSSNELICKYADDHNIDKMGTTAAFLAFSKRNITLCNIGDSKIYKISGNEISQLSKDHIARTSYGYKPPLSQCLGIPEAEMKIEPYITTLDYNIGEYYLISTDGLTDMVDDENIKKTITNETVDNAVKKLINMALDHGGKDNITIILCKIEKKNIWSLSCIKENK